MHSLTLPPTTALAGDVTIPGSKSISNRALLLAALAVGDTRLDNLLDSDDVTVMRHALERLGVRLEREAAARAGTSRPESAAAPAWHVHGSGGALVTTDMECALDLGLAGTALRPLAAALTLGRGRFVLDGIERMRERPIGPLVEGLRQLGARIDYLGVEGYPPVRVHGTGLAGGHVRMAGDLSSQFLTSLLMAAPLARGPVVIDIDGVQVSKPYLAITLHLMRRFGIDVEHEDFQHFVVRPGCYRSPGNYLVEADASSATYFLAAGAIAGPGITVHGIGSDSIQGDLAFVEVLAAMGARVEMAPTSICVRPGQLRGIDLDLNAIPDAAMTVAVLALFADGPSRLRNIYNWRVKETDRLAAMSTELRKLGASVIEGRDFLCVTPPETLYPATIDTYGDHRIAMSFALGCLGGVPVTINDPGCVSKTFPTYFELFEGLRVSAG